MTIAVPIFFFTCSVYDNAQANAVMQKAITILNIMEGLRKTTRENFHNYLLKECNPESLYYDDDTTYGGEEDLRKATIEVRVSVKVREMKVRKRERGREMRDERVRE